MNTITLRLAYDEDCDNPLDRTYGCEVQLLDFRRRDGDTNIEEYHDWNADQQCYVPHIGLRAKLRAGTAYRLDCFEHGQTSWHFTGNGRDLPWDSGGWDTSKGAGILMWTGKPNDLGKTPAERREHIKGWLTTYNDWLSGACYWYESEGLEGYDYENSCGGLIGYENPCEAVAWELPKERPLRIVYADATTEEIAWSDGKWGEGIEVLTMSEYESWCDEQDAAENGEEWSEVA